ncbi:hypothetical protein TD95_002075 [Thielaviopsis punctulata]|uniref:37S ribosomal protein S22 n=1 Tax=Thielaviopsis punctulata TaxID=72032 RepID=A0A0F4ZJW5_9PEZI|nr:hypothetical protein TD95_002075 [Thielaviopsis punctulata]
MLSVRGARTVRPAYRLPVRDALGRKCLVPSPFPARVCTQSHFKRGICSTGARLKQDSDAGLVPGGPGTEVEPQTPEELERVVRDAKQRFRDTLPEGYLKPAEYELYVRLYGAPLRKTIPDDVGIPSHDDFEAQDAPIAGPYSAYDTSATEDHADGETRAYPPEKHEENEYKANYVDIVARSPREYDALKKLEQDFKVAQEQAAKEAEELQSEEEEQEYEEVEVVYDPEVDPEEDENDASLTEMQKNARLHPFTQDARFGISPGTVQLPPGRMVRPVTEMLKRTSPSHIRIAAQNLFGGPGLPDGPSTPQSMKMRDMKPIPVNVNHRRMQPIDSDVILATYMPPVYASIFGVLVEVRKRLGSTWLKDLIAKHGDDGPRVLDVGGVGGGIIAWEQILGAEWKAMRERGDVSEESKPRTRKTVVLGAEHLRDRVAKMMGNTTFLPRIPDYVHSADNADRVLDGPQKPQTRKSYDIILASHQLLPAEEGHKRRAVLNQLWALLNPDGGVLVIIEKAHPRGFEAIAEARSRLLNEFILPPGAEPQKEDISGNFVRVKEPGMVVAPCTSQGKCPLYLVEGRSSGRKDFCYFAQRYIRPPYLQSVLQAKHKNNDDVEFSYVVIQRGTAGPAGVAQDSAATERAFRGFEHSGAGFAAQALPRNIRPPLKKRGHVSMDVCTPDGRFERWTVTKSFSRAAYHDARKIRWGDLWALGAKTRSENRVRMGRGEVVKDGGVKGRAARADETRSTGRRPEVVNMQMNALGKAAPVQKPMKGYHHTKGGRHMARAQASKEIRNVEGELDKVLHDGAAGSKEVDNQG